MLGRLGLLVASALLSLALAEAGARAWLASADDDTFGRYASREQRESRAESRGEGAFRYSPHAYLGWIPTPDHHRGDNHHNALGFRGNAFERRKPDGEFRIVCLGGSTTYTSGVAHSAFAFPPILQTALRRMGYDTVSVVNGGAEGYSSYESLLNLQFRVLELEPDLVIVYHGINDLLHRFVWPPSAFRADNSGAMRRSAVDATPWWQASTVARIAAIRAGWMAPPSALHSTFVELPDTAFGFELLDQLRTHRYPKEIFLEAPAEAMLAANGTQHFEANLEQLARTARAEGVSVVFATFASARRHADPGLTSKPIRAGLAEMNRALLALGGRIGVPVYDFASEFPDDPRLWFDPVHVNVKGANEKGRLFARYLDASGLLRDAHRGDAR